MEEIFAKIIERIEFEQKDKFLTLLTKSIHISKDTEKSTYAVSDNIAFKISTYFKGFNHFHNEFGKEKKNDAGVHALMIVCEELGIEIEPAECFILFHIKDIGKFRLSEKKLHAEIKIEWKNHHNKQYALEDQDFSYALKSLMRKKFINYRRGNLHLNETVVLRYR